MASLSASYSSAKSAVSSQLSQLTDQLFSSVDTRRSRDANTPEERAEAVYVDSIGHSDAASLKFRGIYELDKGRYWLAMDFLGAPNVRSTISDEEWRMYAGVMVEDAMRSYSDKSMRGYNPHVWIVKKYNDGLLKDVVPQETLRESVNIGFWEIADAYLTVGRGISLPNETYDAIMQHSDMLDLERVKEFMKDRPMIDDRWWVDKRYISAFRRAEQKLSLDPESTAWLARPIIESILRRIESDEFDEGAYDELLKPYGRYMKFPVVQDFLISDVYSRVCNESFIGSRDSDKSAVRYIAKYLSMGKEDFKKFISSIFLERKFSYYDIEHMGFPFSWLTEDAVEKTRIEIEERLTQKKDRGLDLHSIGETDGLLKKGYLDTDRAKRIVESHLRYYLRQGRRVGPASGKTALEYTDPTYVDTELYMSVVVKAINSMAMHNKLVDATYWYERAKQSGHLDESRIVSFERKYPEPKKQKSYRSGPRTQHTRGERKSKKVEPSKYDMKITDWM